MGRGISGSQGIGPTGDMMPPPTSAGVPPASPYVPPGGSEIDALKAEAQNLETQLRSINDRIDQLEGGTTPSRLVAAVDAGRCTGCSMCEGVCPVNAITVEETAYIDTAKCTGCGQCVAECRNGALTLRKA